MVQKRYAYLIGANGPQQSPIIPLQYAEEDAMRLKEAFINEKCNFYNVEIMTSGTFSNILTGLEIFAEKCEKDDLLIVHFSGHAKSENGELYLIRNNTEFRQDGQLRFTTTINIRDIKQILNRCQARDKLLILDCCYAGAALKGGAFKGIDEVSEMLVEQLKGGISATLTACSSKQRARELDTLNGGFLSWVIASACNDDFSKVANNGALSLTDIWYWLANTALNKVNSNLSRTEQIPQPHLLNYRVAGIDNEIWFTDKRHLHSELSSGDNDNESILRCPDANVEDFDREKVQEYAKCQPDHDKLPMQDMQDLCRCLGLTTKEYIPYYSAVLAFHRMPSRYLPSALVRVTMYGLSSEGPYLRDDIEGPLSEQAERTIAWLNTNLSTVSENISAGQRIDRCEIPEQALRELIVNAILHRNYNAPESVHVKITPRQVIITNPGQLEAMIEQAEPPFSYSDTHPKNPELVIMLTKQLWAEGRGHGFRVIREEFKKYKLPLPDICNLHGLVRVVIQRPGLSTMRNQSHRSRYPDTITLEICITRSQSPEAGKTYLVSASEITPHNSVRTAQTAFTISSNIEQQLHLLLAGSKAKDTKVLEGVATRAREIGIELFNSLFQPEVRMLYDEIKIRAREQGAVIQLRLQIIPPELSTLPWELLYDDEQYLCLSRHPKILFARVPATLVEKESQPYRPPLRLLAVTASLDGWDKLALEKEKEYIDTALQDLIQEKRVEIAWEKAVVGDLKFDHPWHVFHFIGHGYLDQKGNLEPKLTFEDAQGESYGIDAHRLSLALHENTQLVFLKACAPHHDQSLSRFVHQLATSGIPAIVALQLPITDETALQFARIFYERVAHGDAVDEAVTRARHHIYTLTKAGSLAWMAPILYISTSSGISFKETSTVSVVSESGNPVSPPVADHPQPEKPTLKPKRFLFGINMGAVTLIFLLIFALISVSVFQPFAPQKLISATPTPPSLPGGIGTFKAPNGEMIGISDGRYPFDTDGTHGRYKKDAAKALQQNKTAEAIALLQTAIFKDPGDAEAHIYLENQRVLSSGKPYINIVLGVAMAGNILPLSQHVLQGAYAAQHDYNQSHDVQVRLLIASSGSSGSSYVKTVAEQIVQLARADQRTVAVMGWADSSSTHNALPILAKAPLVMLSQSASNTLLTGISPYFFRIVPPNEVQAEAGASYAREELSTNNVAIFGDATDPYSQDLAASFGSKFIAKGGKIVASTSYKRGETKHFQSLLEGALKNNPDLIYFAGHSSDIRALLALLPTTGKFAQLRVMAGDAGGGVDARSKPAGYHRLIYTAFAHSDVWKIAGSKQLPFLDDEYSIVSYDAVRTLLTGCEIALELEQGEKPAITPDTLRKALTQITGSRSLQGISGQISFDAGHDPAKKPVFIVQVRQDGSSYIVSNGIRGGCYIKGCA